MATTPSRNAIAVVVEPQPYGDVTLMPCGATGRAEAELARAMATAITDTGPSSGSEALRILRRTFPDSPLAVRVAALDAMMRR
ncbi:MAG: hypothetical protein DPW22_04605 [Alphaproteobacteria bacterium]|nr:hypothetical protein [Alphaproteobacteria bacterium]